MFDLGPLVIGFIFGLTATGIFFILYFKNKVALKDRSIIDAQSKCESYRAQVNSLEIKGAELSERLKLIDEIKIQLSEQKKSVEYLQNQRAEALAEVAKLNAEKQKLEEFSAQRIQDLTNVEDKMQKAFAEVSQSSLVKNAAIFQSQVKQNIDQWQDIRQKESKENKETLANILSPLKESLKQMDDKVQKLESLRQGAYSGLLEQIEGLKQSQAKMEQETIKLARSLSSPTVRGRWGEMQLKRVVELSGLSAHCDFVEQSSQSDDEKTVRPDMIVTMPGGKQIVVDAKAPLDSFILDNNQSGDDEKKSSENLAQSLRRHLLTLSKKSYHKSVSSSPEFVVMFLPGELFFYKAMSADNNLIEFASKHSVVIATPMTLIALLKAVAFGFRQEAIAKNMEAVRQLSQRLIDRINKVGQHFERLGKNLKMATESYNQTLASLESRVLVTAKQLAELGDHKIDPGQEKNIAAASPVLVTPRSFAAISESE